MPNEISFTAAKFEHVKIVYNIRNNPAVRKNLVNNSDINYFDHVKFYKKMLENKKHKIYLVFYYYIPVGFFDIKIDSDHFEVEVGFKLFESHQGKGIGTKMLKQSIKVVEKMLPDYDMILTVFSDNHVAKNLYKKYGFKPVKNELVRGKRLITMKRRC